MTAGRFMSSYYVPGIVLGFPGGSAVKNLPANARRHRRCRFDPWLGKVPWRRTGQWQSTAVVLSGKSHGQRSLVGYSPWGSKGLDMTEKLSVHTHLK